MGSRERGSLGQGAEKDQHGVGAGGQWEGSAFLKSSLSQKNPRFSKSKDSSPPAPPLSANLNEGPAATACPQGSTKTPSEWVAASLLQISAMTLWLTCF